MKLVPRLPTKDKVADNVFLMLRTSDPAKESVAGNTFCGCLTSAPAKLKVAVKARRNDLLGARFPTNDSVAENPESRSFLVSDPAKDSVAVNPESRSFLVTAPLKVCVAANAFNGSLDAAPANDSVAVKARRKDLLGARLPTNDSVAVNVVLVSRLVSAPVKDNAAVNPESRSFLVSAPVKVCVAARLFCGSLANAPAKDKVAVNARKNNLVADRAPTNDSPAVNECVIRFVIAPENERPADSVLPVLRLIAAAVDNVAVSDLVNSVPPPPGM